MTYFGSKLLTYRLRQKEGVSKLKGLTRSKLGFD